jgi:hypothetical protein
MALTTTAACTDLEPSFSPSIIFSANTLSKLEIASFTDEGWRF